MRCSATSPSQLPTAPVRDHRRHQGHEAADRETDEAEGHELGDVGDRHQRAERGGEGVAVGRGAGDERSQQRAGGAHEHAQEGRPKAEKREAAAFGAETSEARHPCHQQDEGAENALQPCGRQRHEDFGARR